MKVTKKKATFYNCSACKKKLYANFTVRYSAEWRWNYCRCWGYWALVCVGTLLFLFSVHQSCLRQKLRRHH